MKKINEFSLELFLTNVDHYLKNSDSVKISLERKTSKIGLPEIEHLKKESKKRNYLMKVEIELPQKTINEPAYGMNCEKGVIYHLNFCKKRNK